MAPAPVHVLAPHTMNRISVEVPASTSNLGPGFDVLGLALGLHLRVAAQPADALAIDYHGAGPADAIPRDQRNLVHRAIAVVYSRAGRALPPLHVAIDNPIPLHGGLGSSGAAAVAGVLLGCALSQLELSHDEQLQLACALEGHPDNVSASLYGGLTLSRRVGDRWVSFSPSIPDPPLAVILHPKIEIPTQKARALLPTSIPRAQAVENLANTAALVAGLLSKPRRLSPDCFRDYLHQPARRVLMPWFPQVVAAAVEAGAEGCFLSGSGPSILAFTSPAKAPIIKSAMAKAMTAHTVPFDTLVLPTAVAPARVVES
ncbi:homoserine kinase [bacterium]|nr:homoserine kinase [bacterium]